MDRTYAKQRLRHLLAEGLVVKPARCEGCGVAMEPENIKGFHWKRKPDFPTQVLWYCQKCISAYLNRKGAPTVEAEFRMPGPQSAAAIHPQMSMRAAIHALEQMIPIEIARLEDLVMKGEITEQDKDAKVEEMVATLVSAQEHPDYKAEQAAFQKSRQMEQEKYLVSPSVDTTSLAAPAQTSYFDLLDQPVSPKRSLTEGKSAKEIREEMKKQSDSDSVS